MLSKRTRQAFAATAVVLCASSTTASAVKQQLRANPATDEEAHATARDLTQQQRDLGSVIMLDVENNSNGDNLEPAIANYPQFTGTAIDYSQDLVTQRSGPHESNSTIDIEHHKSNDESSTTSSRNDIVMTDRVVGGFNSGPKPWYSMLLYKDSAGWKFAGCGATLITNCHVITAAHCVEDRDFDIEGIYQNAHTPYNGNSGNAFHFTSAQKIFVPDNYDDYTNVNDIAIIRLSQCVNVKDYPPAMLATPANTAHITNGDMLSLYGFGRFGENMGQSGDTKQLQRAQLPYISNGKCQSYFGNKIRYGMFCAGYPETGGVDACQGDSGSGILAPSQTTGGPDIILGVVSWGVGCARKGYPGVYANIADYFDWIKDNVCDDAELDSSISWCSNSRSVAQPDALMLRSTQCANNDPCELCEGECQNDNQCAGDMQCFRRTNQLPFQLIPGCRGTGVANRNYCYDPNLSRYADFDYDNKKDKEKSISEDTASRTTMWTTSNFRGGGGGRSTNDESDHQQSRTKRKRGRDRGGKRE